MKGTSKQTYHKKTGEKMKREEKNLSGEKLTMFRILKDAKKNKLGGWIKSVSIPSEGGPWRYTDTIMKLRRLGFSIDSRRVEGKNYCEYKLL